MKQLFILIIAITWFGLLSCAHFHDTNTSVWSGGLWILPWLTGIGAIVCYVLAYFSSKSNSTTQTKHGTIDNTGNVPITKLGLFWFGVALTVATIIIVYVVNHGR
jgi:heme/copper-type cytochrome/quinol oxidase subunit 2